MKAKSYPCDKKTAVIFQLVLITTCFLQTGIFAFTTHVVAQRFAVALVRNCDTNQPSIVGDFGWRALLWLCTLALLKTKIF